jgi:predicted Zn-dependent protease
MRLALCFAAAWRLAAADPSIFDARKAEIRGLLERGEDSAALERAVALNRASPDDVDGWRLLAEAHLALGNYAEAERAAQWMADLRIGRADAAGWMTIARFREATGDVSGAIDAVNTAYAQLGPAQERERLELMTWSAGLHWQAGQVEAAARLIERRLEGAREDEAAQTVLARVRLAQGRRADAVAALRDRRTGAPHPRLLYGLAELTGRPADWSAYERAALGRRGAAGNADR